MATFFHIKFEIHHGNFTHTVVIHFSPTFTNGSMEWIKSPCQPLTFSLPGSYFIDRKKLYIPVPKGS